MLDIQYHLVFFPFILISMEIILAYLIACDKFLIWYHLTLFGLQGILKIDLILEFIIQC